MRCCLAIAVLLTAGCAAPSRDAPPAVALPAERVAAPAPSEHWVVSGSLLEVRVYRDGPMQRLGHNHVIVSGRLAGTVHLREPLSQSGFELSLPLDSLVVDDPAARSRAGTEFAAPVPTPDREATRRNLLGEALLDAAAYPVLRLTAEGLSGGPDVYAARVRVALRGGEHVLTAPFTVERVGFILRAKASFGLTHAELGLEPFTAALGALRVRDRIEVELRLEARRAS